MAAGLLAAIVTLSCVGLSAARPGRAAAPLDARGHAGPLVSGPIEALLSRSLGADSRRYWISRLRGSSPDMVLQFSRSGVSVSTRLGKLGLSLGGVSRGQAVDAVAPANPLSARNRVVFRHGALDEWYLNGPAGLEQGFTFATRPLPGRGGPLTLTLNMSGDLSATLDRAGAGTSLLLRDSQGADALRYGDLTVTDRAGRTVPARLTLRGRQLAIEIDDRSAVYPLTVDPFVQVAELSASHGANNDALGSSMAMSGNTLVVGAPDASSGEGAAYVFVEPPSGWTNATETAKLTDPDGKTGDHFGATVAISGNTVVVGAPDASNGTLTKQGAVYVFQPRSGGWSAGPPGTQARLFDPAEKAGVLFGSSVAISGNTIVAGAPAATLTTKSNTGATINEANAGAAYVFVEPLTGWQPDTPSAATLAAATPVAGAQLGSSVAISGDTAVAGAPMLQVGANSQQGEVALFVKPASGWLSETQATWLVAQGGQSQARLGTSVAMSGDVIAAGAPQILNDGKFGTVYVFYRPDGNPPFSPQTFQAAQLESTDHVDEVDAGTSVAIDGGTIVAGGPNFDSGAGPQGVVWEWTEGPSGWGNASAETNDLEPSDIGGFDRFGTSATVSGQDAAGGGPGRNSSQGAAWVFQAPGPNSDTVGASAITQHTATLSATVNPLDHNVTDCHFNYGATIEYGFTVPCSSSPGGGVGNVSVSAPVSGLQPDTTYHFEISATNSAGSHLGADLAFTTPGPPKVATGAASNITETSATLSGTVNPDGASTSCRVAWWVSILHPSFAPCSPSPGSGTAAVPVSASITGLTLGTTYNFAIEATNAYGTTTSTPSTFSTQGVATGRAGSGPAPQPPNTKPLSPTSCTGTLTQMISAVGGSFQITGCVTGDNEGQYLVKGRFTMNGLTVTPDGTVQTGAPATFSCLPTDKSCTSLLTSYTNSTSPEFIIDTKNLKVGGNSSYTFATGSSTLYDGKITGAGNVQSATSPSGASFNPQDVGLELDSGPAIQLSASAGSTQLNFHKLPIAGPVVIFPKGSTGAELQLSVKIPVVGLGGQALLSISPDGSEDLRGLTVTVAHFSIPGTGIDLGDVVFSFNLDTETWSAGATDEIPGLDIGVGLEVEIVDGNFGSVEGSVDGLDVPVPGTEGLVTINSASAGIEVHPAIALFGSVGLSAGPEVFGKSLLSINGGFHVAFGADFPIEQFGDIITSPIRFDDVPFNFGLTAQSKIAGLIPFGSVNLNFLLGLSNYDPVIYFAGGLGNLGGRGCTNPNNPETTGNCTPQGYDIKVGSLTLAAVNANVYALLLGDHFNAEGFGSVNVLGLGLSGKALISTKGIVACANFFSIATAKDAAASATSGSSSPGSQTLAADVVSNANLRAVAATSGKQPERRIRALKADIKSLEAQGTALVKAAKQQGQAIVAGSRSTTKALEQTSMRTIDGAGSRYLGGRLTQDDATSQLLDGASSASADLQGASNTGANQLQALEQATQTKLRALAQQALQDASQLQVLESGAARAGDPVAMQAGVFSFLDPVGSFFGGLGNDILSGFDYLWNGIKGIAADAAKAVGDAIVAVAKDIGGLADEALQAFENGMQKFVGAIAQLGKDAIAGLKQFAQDVANVAVKIADDIANLFNAEIGVGYQWGGVPTFYPTGGCSVGPYIDETGLQPGSASDAHAAAASTLHLTSGSQFTVLRFKGRGAPPLVRVTGPGGISLSTPTTSRIEREQGGRALVIRDPTTDSTFVNFQPVTGTYRVALQPGSVAVVSSSKSTALPQPSVTASVTGSGTRRVLHWSATAIRGQNLTFSVQDAAGTHVITSTAATHGSVAFAAAPGLSGLDTVLVQVEQNGYASQGFEVASFQAPIAPAPGRPRGLSITRRGETVSARWSSGGGTVLDYQVQFTTTGGLDNLIEVTRHGLTYSNIVPADAVSVQVTAIGASGQRSAPAVLTLAGRGLSACLAPTRVTVHLEVHGRLRNAVALIGRLPVAVNRQGGTVLVVPLGGTIGTRAVLTVKATTKTGKQLHASYVFILCSGRAIPTNLKLTLR